MRLRIAAVAAFALAAGLLAGAPSTAAPDTTITLRLSHGGRATDYYSIVARQSDGTGRASFYGGHGAYTGRGNESGSPGLTPGTWTFEVYDFDEDRYLFHAFRRTLVAGENDLGTVDFPDQPFTDQPLRGRVRSVKGTPLKGLDVEMYAVFPGVTVKEARRPVAGGRYSYANGYSTPQGYSNLAAGTKRPVIRPRLGTLTTDADYGRSKFLEPVTGYASFVYKNGSSVRNLTYRPRPFLKLNGAYRTSFTRDETYMPWSSRRSTITVARNEGKILLSAYANVRTYGLERAGGAIALEIDGKVVKRHARLTSKDRFRTTVSGLAPGQHVLKVKYRHGPETRSSVYTYDLVVR